MRCKIADLIVEIPEAGGLAPRCKAYLEPGADSPHIQVRQEDYAPAHYYGNNEALTAYMESGFLFYMHLLRFGGMMLHASAVTYEGRAYLFSGPSGVGKSTHTRLWQETFGQAAQIINDDKPALRLLEDRWYAYGTPWSGKHGINQNTKAPLGGICFLKRGTENRIRRLTAPEAVPLLFMQTNSALKKKENMQLLLGLIERLLQTVPIYELENRPEQAAALLSMQTMQKGAEEAGL